MCNHDLQGGINPIFTIPALVEIQISSYLIYAIDKNTKMKRQGPNRETSNTKIICTKIAIQKLVQQRGARLEGFIKELMSKDSTRRDIGYNLPLKQVQFIYIP